MEPPKPAVVGFGALSCLTGLSSHCYKLRHALDASTIKKSCRFESFSATVKGSSVNKSELIEAIAASADIPKAAASRALDAMVDSVTDSLKKGDSVSLVGFGTFAVKERAARTGRNPQTGEPIQISAAKVPSFKAGKALKDSVN